MAGDKIKWTNAIQGEPETWVIGQRHYTQCCTCGLTHLKYIERIDGDKVIVKTYRDDWLTKQARRGKGRRKG